MRSSSLTSTSLRERCGRILFEPSCLLMARCVEALFLRCLHCLCAVVDDFSAHMNVPCLRLYVRLFGWLDLLLRALCLFHYRFSSSIALSSRFECFVISGVFFDIIRNADFYCCADVPAPLATSLRVPAAGPTLGFFSLCTCRLTAERTCSRKVL